MKLWETKLIEARVLTSIDIPGTSSHQLIGQQNNIHSHYLPHKSQWNNSSLFFESQSMKQGFISTHPTTLKRLSSSELQPSSSASSKHRKLAHSEDDDNSGDTEITSLETNSILTSIEAPAEDLLGSDLDDSEDDSDFQDIDNIILCQFEKVSIINPTLTIS